MATNTPTLPAMPSTATMVERPAGADALEVVDEGKAIRPSSAPRPPAGAWRTRREQPGEQADGERQAAPAPIAHGGR